MLVPLAIQKTDALAQALQVLMGSRGDLAKRGKKRTPDSTISASIHSGDKFLSRVPANRYHHRRIFLFLQEIGV
jgi:hypothetical protein